MKKIILTLFAMSAILSTSNAQSVEPVYPEVEYPTVMIAQFMSFCMNLTTQRMMMERQDQMTAFNNAGFICSCVMDNYRLRNEQAEFQFELSRKNEKDVPLFKEYFDSCYILNRTNANYVDPTHSILF